MLNFRSLNRLCLIRLNLKRTWGCWFGKALFLSWNVNGNSHGISQCTFLNHTASFDRSLLFRPLNGPCPKLINGISQEVIYTLQWSDSNSSSFFFIPAFCFSSSAFFIWTSVSWLMMPLVRRVHSVKDGGNQNARSVFLSFGRVKLKKVTMGMCKLETCDSSNESWGKPFHILIIMKSTGKKAAPAGRNLQTWFVNQSTNGSSMLARSFKHKNSRLLFHLCVFLLHFGLNKNFNTLNDSFTAKLEHLK